MHDEKRHGPAAPLDCERVRAQIPAYFEARLEPPAEASRLEAHLEECAACQQIELVEPQLAAWLEGRLGVSAAPAGLAARIAEQLAVTPAPAAGPDRVRRPALARVFGSAWGPRLALAAMVLVLVAVPIRNLFDPAIARLAAASYEAHSAHTGPGTPSCCTLLDLRPGDALGDPSGGTVIPDLASDGLELVSVTRCVLDGELVHILAYRAAGSRRPAALYVTDRLAERFRGRTGRTRTRPRQASLGGNAVSLWEHGGVVYCWVAPSTDVVYASALADVQHELQH